LVGRAAPLLLCELQPRIGLSAMELSGFSPGGSFHFIFTHLFRLEWDGTRLPFFQE
jgi:hypothetical protein